ncbi:cysteine hydrolase family protein [Nocardia spumae]|uniref:cysteine hydrolase family protein n=1 Tax=Nocardia spumae TaxID=2887190 RepID=UPI001D147C4D|nr:cysteine hydrolase family protein [Nocardia spumae]
MSAVSTPLRQVSGLDDGLPRLADATVVMIDFQNTYREGVMALPNADAALVAGARLLSAARELGRPIVHIVNDAGPGTPYDIRAEIGAIIADVAPEAGEPVVVKNFPDAFHETDLHDTLRSAGAGPDLVLAGFMTHLCVAFTAQGAFNRGYRPTVVAEACATRALAAPDRTPLPADVLHTAALTTVGDLFGLICPTVADLLD